MKNMTASHAEQEQFDVLVDIDGGIWVRVAGVWDYISSSVGLSDWDSKAELPKQYEPFNSLDANATRFILRALKIARLEKR